MLIALFRNYLIEFAKFILPNYICGQQHLLLLAAAWRKKLEECKNYFACQVQNLCYSL